MVRGTEHGMRDHPMILFLEEQPAVRDAALQALRAANPRWDVVAPRSPAEALERVIRDEVAVVVCNQTFGGKSGADLLAEVRALSPETVAILTIDSIDMQTIVDGINFAGAFRALAKPFPEMRLLSDVAEAIVEHRRRTAVQQLVDHLISQGARAAA